MFEALAEARRKLAVEPVDQIRDLKITRASGRNSNSRLHSENSVASAGFDLFSRRWLGARRSREPRSRLPGARE